MIRFFLRSYLYCILHYGFFFQVRIFFFCFKPGCIGGGLLFAFFVLYFSLSLIHNHDDDGHDMNTWVGCLFISFLALKILQERYIICKEYWVCRLLFSMFFFFLFLCPFASTISFCSPSAVVNILVMRQNSGRDGVLHGYCFLVIT